MVGQTNISTFRVKELNYRGASLGIIIKNPINSIHMYIITKICYLKAKRSACFKWSYKHSNDGY